MSKSFKAPLRSKLIREISECEKVDAGFRLKLILKVQEKSIRFLACYLGLTEQMVHRWLDGKAPIHPKYIKSICSFLDDEINPRDLRPDIF